MPIIGAVLTLREEGDLPEQVLGQLLADPRLEPGERNGCKLPVVLDVPDRETERTVWKALGDLEGVLQVDLAFADFSDLHETQETN